MILRNVGRHPVRAATSVIGIAASVSMLVLGTFFLDSIDVLMDLQFNVIQRQDVTVTFVLPASGRALHEMRRLPGVIYAEPMRAVPARLRASQRSRIVSISGLVANPELNRVVDVEAGALRLPPDGLVLSLKLAEVLGVRRGDLGDRRSARRPQARQARPRRRHRRGVHGHVGVHGDRRAAPARARGKHAVGRLPEGRCRRTCESLYRRLKETPVVAGVSLKRSGDRELREDARRERSTS